MPIYDIPQDIEHIVNPDSPGITFQFVITHCWNGTSHLNYPDMNINPEARAWVGQLLRHVGDQLLANR